MSLKIKKLIAIFAIFFITINVSWVELKADDPWTPLTRAWTYFSNGNLQKAVETFKDFVENPPPKTENVYISGGYLGLGTCYASPQMKMYYEAKKCLLKAISLDPNGKNGLSAKKFMETKLKPVELDLSYQKSTPLSYEETMALILHNLGYENAAIKNNGTVVKDANGNLPSKWASGYVAATVSLRGIKDVPNSFKDKVSRLWTAKLILNLKGYDMWNFETPVTYKDTQKLSTDDQMIIGTIGWTKLLDPVTKDKFNPDGSVDRTILAKMLLRAGKLKQEGKDKIKYIPDTADAAKGKILNQYFVNDSVEMLASQEEAIKLHGEQINRINMSYATIRAVDNGFNKFTGTTIKSFGNRKLILENWDSTSTNKFKNYISLAKSKGIQTYLLLSDAISGDANEMKTLENSLFKDSEACQGLADRLIEIVTQMGMDGVDVDIEMIDSGAKDDFTSFIKCLSDGLKSKAKKLCVFIAAASRKSNETRCDYQAIGKLADNVTIPFYNLYTPNGINEKIYGGPMNSPEWMDKILKYAVYTIPSKKILMGIPTFGWDYNLDKRTAGVVTQADFYKIKANAAPESYKYEYVEASNLYRAVYTDKNGDKHQAWIEDSKSLEGKAKLMNKFNLGGMTVWHLGYEDDDFWKFTQKFLN